MRLTGSALTGTFASTEQVCLEDFSLPDFEEGRLVCDGVSIPMCEFPDNTSEIAPIEHLSQDCLDCNKENDEDDDSFEDDFMAETLDGLCEAGDIQAIVDSCAHLAPEQ